MEKKKKSVAVKEKLRRCIERDACEHPDCCYYIVPDQWKYVLEYIEELEKENAELKAENKEIYDNPGEWLAGM